METINIGNITIEIVQDTDPESPRYNDNLGTMICFHRRYNLGDKHHFRSDMFSGWEDMERHFSNGHIILPLYLYDHGGITIDTKPFGCPWDSGQVGYIVVDKEKVKKEYEAQKLTPKIKQKVLSILNAEVEEYNKYITGEVYGYRIIENGEEVDSCWGFYGLDHCRQQALINANLQTA